MTDREKSVQRLLSLYRQAYLLAYRIIGDKGHAEDAVQTGYMHALENIRFFENESEMRSWILRIVANAAKNICKSENRRRTRERKAAMKMPNVVEQLQTGSEVTKEEVKAVVASALQNLEENFRLAVSLHYEQGLTYSEAGEIAGVNPMTLRQRASRGIKKLRRALAADGFNINNSALLVTINGGIGATAPKSLLPALKSMFLQHGYNVVATSEASRRAAAHVAKTLARSRAGATISLPAKVIAFLTIAAVVGLAVKVLNKTNEVSSVPVKQVPERDSGVLPADNGAVAPESVEVSAITMVKPEVLPSPAWRVLFSDKLEKPNNLRWKTVPGGFPVNWRRCLSIDCSPFPGAHYPDTWHIPGGVITREAYKLPLRVSVAIQTSGKYKDLIPIVAFFPEKSDISMYVDDIYSQESVARVLVRENVYSATVQNRLEKNLRMRVDWSSPQKWVVTVTPEKIIFSVNSKEIININHDIRNVDAFRVALHGIAKKDVPESSWVRFSNMKLEQFR